MHKDKSNNYPVSRALLELSRVWVYMALGALVLYFIVAAIERNHVTVRITATRSYRIPVEHDPESEAE